MTFMDAVITGLATGLGCAVGTYLAQKAILRNMEKLETEVKKVLNGKDNN